MESPNWSQYAYLMEFSEMIARVYKNVFRTSVCLLILERLESG